MISRFSLINAGLFPETLPPCFVSNDAQRAFRGIVAELDSKEFNQRRTTEFAKYSGTKHDGNRRFFGTPNIVSYFHVSTFIHKNWSKFESRFSESNYSVGVPRILDQDADRAIQVPSLSELSARASKNIGFAPIVLKTDIAQFFPSIYTHSIPWSAHGRDESKADQKPQSKTITFNALDLFVRNCQAGQTRGIAVGPDAFRLIAEFISSGLDKELENRMGEKVVGAVRHVDDYYIGLETEADAQIVLSRLRELLASFELQINDSKTKIYSSLEPVNDLWAQRIRKRFRGDTYFSAVEWELIIDEALETARNVGSDSPVKMLLRGMDEREIYLRSEWDFIEPYLQRIVQRHPHAIDYICLLVVKRYAIDLGIDRIGWARVAEILIIRNLAFNNHHEVVWMFWLLLVCNLSVEHSMVESILKSADPHVKSLILQAFVDGKLTHRPKLGLGGRLATDDPNWLVNLIARSQGYSKAQFSGVLAPEFSHLADKNIKLVDLQSHNEALADQRQQAISRTRYGYDDEVDEEDEY